MQIKIFLGNSAIWFIGVHVANILTSFGEEIMITFADYIPQ